ncbi:hypothetical protein ACEWY4_014862 [Coilia grayii]|uniref:Interferon-induced protein 44-like n=1 Tax=Coilia grayii TaxID=363190 RepID=A0ABD1JTF6_9TELE
MEEKEQNEKENPKKAVTPAFKFGIFGSSNPAAEDTPAPAPLFTSSEPKPATAGRAWPIFQETPWRQLNWSDETRTALLESIRSYKPACDSVPAARVLLVGPVGAGKSSFISSVQSVFYGRVLNRAMVGSSSTSSGSFTKKLQSYQLHSSRERDGGSMALVLSDMVGLGEASSSLTLHDALAAIKGHVPDGHTFSACSPVGSDTAGYVKEPTLAERVHCVAFVVSAPEISTYSKTMTSTLQQLREHISALGVHQVALLTHVDKVCLKTAADVSQVYRSTPLKNVMIQASALLGMPISSMVPVKNYSEELDPEPHTDTLLLTALELILQYVDFHLRDQSDQAHHAESSDHAESSTAQRDPFHL